MRFLVVAKGQPATTPGTPEQMEQFFDATEASLKTIEGWKKEGKVLVSESFASGRGGFGVVETDSIDELYADLQSLPFSAFQRWKVIPLVSLETTLEVLARQRAALRRR